MARDDGISVDEAFKQVGVGAGSWLLVFLAGATFSAYAAEQGFIAYGVHPLERTLGLHASEIVFLEQAVLGGQILGPIFWGRLADRRGRRPALLGSAGMVLVCGLLTAVAQNFWQLVIAQAGVGIGVGGNFLSLDILCELLPKDARGPFCNALQFFWPIGSMILLLCAWCTLELYGWRALSLFAAVPMAAAFVLSLRFLPESPHWLLEQGQTSQARATLEYLARLNGVQTSFGKLAAPEPVHLQQREQAYASWTGHVGKLFKLTAVWFLMDAVYVSLVLLGPTLFTQPAVGAIEDAVPVEQPPALDYFSLGLSSSSELASVVITLLLLDRLGLGRRNFQFILYVVAGIAASCISFREIPYSSLVAAVVTARCALFAASCGTWIHTPELFPVEIRGTAHAMCTFSKNIGSLLAPVLVSQFVSPGVCGALLSMAAVAAGLLVQQLPETRHCTPELYDPSEYLALTPGPLTNSPEMSASSLKDAIKV